jgi:hypothetical protein
MRSKRGFIKYVIVVVLGALCLMADAFYNQYPLIYSDTSTYIVSGFELKPPFDRPITYGLFLRVASLNGLSLWGVIFFQAFILSALLFMFVRLFTGRYFLQYGFLAIVLLSAFTGVSWTVSQPMPDIFTPIALLCIILLLFGAYSRWITGLLFVLFFLAVAMHISHVLLFCCIILLLFVFHKYLLPVEVYNGKKRQLMVLFVLSMASYLMMGAAVSKSKHAFFMGTMVENGILKTYLDEHCTTHQYVLCSYKDSLPPRAWQFLWNEDSPFYKMGGFKGTKAEFNAIISATLSEPKYLKMHIVQSFKATAQQLWRFDIGDGNGKFPPGTLVHQRISGFFGNELEAFRHAKQYSLTHEPFVRFCNTLFPGIIIASTILCLLLLFIKSPVMNGALLFIVLIIAMAILVNAWDCGTFANALDRLGCKMIWLIPLLAMVALFRMFTSRNESR